MLKKFLSIILTLTMLASLAPAIFVSAADAPASAETVLFDVDFEAHSSGQTFAGQAVRAGSEETYLSLGGNVNAEIVTMSDADGGTTQAVKITTNPVAAASTTDGSFRVNYGGYIPPTSGILVTEFKIYIPAQVDSGGELINNDIKRFYAVPFVKRDGVIAVGSAIDKYTALPDALVYGGWTKLKFIQNLDTGEAHAFVNGEYSKTRADTGSTTTRIQINSRYNYLNTDEHIIFDDFKFYVPAPAVASSALADSTDASIRVSPVVTFDKELRGTPSVSNVTVTKVSDGSTVTVNDVTLASDKKAITVDIGENLEYSTSYSVTVSGLTDTGYVPVDDYTFTFTTKPQPVITMADPEFYNDTFGDSSVAVTSLENGLIRASYELTNNHATDTKDVFFFAVLRNDGKLAAIQFKNVSIPAGSGDTFNVAFDVDDYANQAIDIYAWDNMTDKNALMPMYSISAEGITATSVE